MKTKAWLQLAAFGAFLAVVQIVATASGREFYLTQMTMAAYYSVVVLGLCLLMGYAGQISLGHGAFFAIGGYTSAILTTVPWNASGAATRLLMKAGLLLPRPNLYGQTIITAAPGAAFACAIVLSALVALFIGYPSLRLKGHYLAMATLGFGLIVYRIVLGTDFFGSADGITGVPPWPTCFGLTVSEKPLYRLQNYYLAFGLAIAVLVVLQNVLRSRVGRALRSIHDNELAANAMGVDTARLKMQVFVVSAVLAAVAGSLMTHYCGGIGPSEAGAMKSIRYVALVAAGGMASLWGALLVSGILNFLSLRGCFGTLDHAVFGILLIAIISLAPDGSIRSLTRPLRHAWHRLGRIQSFNAEKRVP
jgi:branched-chain amino acid transport system permease protein